MRLLVLPMMGLMATASDAPPLKALATLQPGRWTLSSHDAAFATRSICLGDPNMLLHVRHTDGLCTRFVIADDTRTSVVHYHCQGLGQGRTSVRVETPRLAQIDTQGIADRMPFDLSIAARRVGECQASAQP